MKNEELRKIPGRNYLILAGVIIVTIFLLCYFYMWFDAYKEKKLNMRILDSYMEIINYNELEDYIVENPNSVIYVSVLEDAVIRDFEKQMKKMLKNNVIKRDMLYMDVTNDIKKKDMQKYGISVDNIPLVLAFNDGNISYTYSISQNGYDINQFKNFLSRIEYGYDG